TIFAARLRAGPQVTFTVGRQRVDEIAARLADDFFRFTVFDRDNAAALRAGVELVSDHCEARYLQNSRMIFVRALQWLIGNCLDEQTAGLSGFKTELNLAVENLAALARHNRAGTFSDDGGNDFAARFFNEI